MCMLSYCHADGQVVPFLGLSFPIFHRDSQGKALVEHDPLFCSVLFHPHPYGNSRPQMRGDAVIRNICWGKPAPTAEGDGVEAGPVLLKIDVGLQDCLQGNAEQHLKVQNLETVRL